MDLALIMIILGVLLSIGTVALFAVLVVAIRAEDRNHTPAGTLSRRVLGTYAHHCPHTATCTGRR